jgi:hypothetical protein
VCKLRTQADRDTSPIRMIAQSVGRALRAAARSLYTRQSDYMRRYLVHTEDTADITSVLSHIARILTDAMPPDDARCNSSSAASTSRGCEAPAATSSSPKQLLPMDHHLAAAELFAVPAPMHNSHKLQGIGSGRHQESGQTCASCAPPPAASRTNFGKMLDAAVPGISAEERSKLDPSSPWYHILQVWGCRVRVVCCTSRKRNARVKLMFMHHRDVSCTQDSLSTPGRTGIEHRASGCL